MCTTPFQIINRSNGSLYEVDCRKCDECLYSRSRMLFNMLMDYKSYKRKQLFITLTYSNGYVPYLRFDELNQFFETGVVPMVHRDFDLYHFVSHGVDKFKYYLDRKVPFRYPQKLRFDDVQSLPPLVKSHPKGYLPSFYDDRVGILDNSDIQKFFKLLRHHIDFTYYVVGEYGTNKKLFRPHWHVLLFVPNDTNLDSLEELIRCIWFRCNPEQIKFLRTVAIEKYLSLYISKVSKYSPGLWSLQNRFTYYSCEVGRACSLTLSMLSSDLHYYRVDKNGLVNRYLPNKRQFNILFPIVKNSYVPLTWSTIFQSFFVTPKKLRYRSSRFDRIHIDYHRLDNLSNLYDYSIRVDEFSRKLASQQLRDYLEELPTVYSDHKLESLIQLTFLRDYGFKPSQQVNYFLRHYREQNKPNLEPLKQFRFKLHLNSKIYG